MPFNWIEYLELAKSLQTQQGKIYSQEAAFRSAVSRAYYAAFCYARNFARDFEGFIPRNNVQDHALVKTHFMNQGRPYIARKLDALRKWRNACDYNDIVDDLSELLIDALQKAQEVIEKLR